MSAVRRAVLACTRAMAVVAMVVIAVQMLTITYDVVMRYAFAAPTDWAYPLNSTGVLVATMLAVPHLYATGQHISMDLLHRNLPARARWAADLVTTVATAFLGLVLAISAFGSMTIAWAGGLVGAGTFNIPLWVADAVLCISGVFLLLVALLFPATAPHAPDSAAPAAVPGDADTRAESQGVA